MLKVCGQDRQGDPGRHQEGGQQVPAQIPGSKGVFYRASHHEGHCNRSCSLLLRLVCMLENGWTAVDSGGVQRNWNDILPAKYTYAQ